MLDVVEVLSNVDVVYDAVKVVFGDEVWKGNESFNVDVSVDVGKVVLEIDVKSMFDVLKVFFSVEVSIQNSTFFSELRMAQKLFRLLSEM